MSGRQRGWAVAGVVAAVAGASLWTVMMRGILFEIPWATAAVAVVPLLTVDRPRIFTRACLAVGSGLLAWSAIGAVLLMFVFLPAALFLLFAALAEPGNRPGPGVSAAVPILLAVGLYVALVACQ
ncbi:hypothetical protein AB0469_32585 [Streptomyces sp. NPDC093801]|uniref:hypothetical protein n=1 Tax=Streptomyces sp. NPDC093801 TaxID=3155203 RepID=UPI00344EC666